MIACTVCGKDVESEGSHGGILISADGDFVCSKACEDKFKKDRDHFFDVIIHDDKLFNNWLGVPQDIGSI